MAALLAAGGLGFLLLILLSAIHLPVLLGFGPVATLATILAVLLAVAGGVVAGLTHVASGFSRMV